MRASADLALLPRTSPRRVPWGLGGLLARGVGLLPRSALPALGRLLGWFVGNVVRLRRQHVERSMKHAGIVRSRAPLLASDMYRSLGLSFIEMLWLAARPKVEASQLASLDEYSQAVLGAARERGRGVVLATAHTGNWELAAAALAEKYPLTVVTKPMSVGWVDRFCVRARMARGIGLASPVDALRTSREALSRGEIVAMLIDQVPARASQAVMVEFLCGKVDVDRAPASLAAATGAPLVLAVSRRAGGVQALEVLAFLEPPERDRRAWAVEATRTATRVFERWVHAHPSQWMWLHRRWRRAPGSPAKMAPGSRAPQAFV